MGLPVFPEVGTQELCMDSVVFKSNNETAFSDKEVNYVEVTVMLGRHPVSKCQLSHCF